MSTAATGGGAVAEEGRQGQPAVTGDGSVTEEGRQPR